MDAKTQELLESAKDILRRQVMRHLPYDDVEIRARNAAHNAAIDRLNNAILKIEENWGTPPEDRPLGVQQAEAIDDDEFRCRCGCAGGITREDESRIATQAEAMAEFGARTFNDQTIADQVFAHGCQLMRVPAGQFDPFMSTVLDHITTPRTKIPRRIAAGVACECK